MKCKFCEFNTISERRLNDHLKNKHAKEYASESGRILCPICNSYASLDLTQHVLKIHKLTKDQFKEKYNISLVSYSVSSKRTFSKHKTQKEKNGIYCELCKKTLPTKDEYDKHFYANDAIHSQIVFNDSNKDDWIECEICGYRSASIVYHVRDEHKISSKEYKECYGELKTKLIIKKLQIIVGIQIMFL
jgi:hypothetical protein